jgi:hypothetical protein
MSQALDAQDVYLDLWTRSSTFGLNHMERGESRHGS